MPLEALYSLIKEQKAALGADDLSPLNGFEGGQSFLGVTIQVTQEYFQSNTNGIDKTKVSDDVLGFCSLVLSFAKGATISLGPSQSPKLFFSFMPRTEFNTVYQQVKSKMPGDLFTLFNSLACYTTGDGGEVV